MALAAGLAARGAQLENGDFTAQLNGLRLWYKVSGRGPVCLMPTPDWGPSSDYCFRTLKPMETLFTMAYLDSRGTGRSQHPQPTALPFYWSDPSKIARFNDDFAATTFSADAASNQWRRFPFDLPLQLKKITPPALIIVGADDFICLPTCAKKMHLGLKNSKLLVIENCGHFPLDGTARRIQRPTSYISRSAWLSPIKEHTLLMGQLETTYLDLLAREFDIMSKR